MSKTAWIPWCAVGGIVLASLGSIGCTVPGDPCEGYEDLCTGTDPDPISTFDGEWLSTDYGYAFRIESHLGRVTLSNSDVYGVGDIILVITSADATGFTARHQFSDGAVYDVIGRLLDFQTLYLTGNGYNWTMVRLGNSPPAVDAGRNVSIAAPINYVDLDATVADDGLPNGTITTTWSMLTGPAAAVFTDPNAIDTTVTFPQTGNYLLQLLADDGELTAADTVTIFVR